MLWMLLCPSELHPILTYVDRAGWVRLSVIKGEDGEWQFLVGQLANRHVHASTL